MESELSPGPRVAAGGIPRVDHLGVIGRHRFAVVVVVAWALGLAALYSFTRTPVYTSEAAVLVRPAVTSIGQSEGEVNPDTESQVVESTAVARLAAVEMGRHPRIERMLANVSVDVPENTEILRILYSSPDPVSARDGARAFADAYLGFRRTEAEAMVSDLMSTLQRELDVVNPEIDDLRARLTDPSLSDAEESQIRNRLRDITARRQAVQNQLFFAQTKTIDPGEVIASPLVPNAPSSPNHKLDLAIGAILGLGLGFGLAYVRDRRETGFGSAAELEEALGGIPVLGVIPSYRDEHSHRGDPIALYRSGGPISEAYRTLRAAILWRAARSRLVTIAVTSARSGEGSTMTSAMLGIALASAGKRVILIDADLRREPSRGDLGRPGRPGLADVLAGAVGSVSEVLQDTSVPNLLVAARGSAGPDVDPAELVQPDRMMKVLEECAGADFVVIDAPPVLAVADALVIAPLADGVLLVSAAQGATRQAIDFARVQLERTGASVVGGVLVGLRRPVRSGDAAPRVRRRTHVPLSPQPAPSPNDRFVPVEAPLSAVEPVAAPREPKTMETEAPLRRTRSTAPPRAETTAPEPGRDEPVAPATEATEPAPAGPRRSHDTTTALPDEPATDPLDGAKPVPAVPGSSLDPPSEPRSAERPRRRGSRKEEPSGDGPSARAKTDTSAVEQLDASGPTAEPSSVAASPAVPSGSAPRGRKRPTKRRPRPPADADHESTAAIAKPRAPKKAPASAPVDPEPGPEASSAMASGTPVPPSEPPTDPQPRSDSRSERQGPEPAADASANADETSDDPTDIPGSGTVGGHPDRANPP